MGIFSVSPSWVPKIKEERKRFTAELQCSNTNCHQAYALYGFEVTLPGVKHLWSCWGLLYTWFMVFISRTTRASFKKPRRSAFSMEAFCDIFVFMCTSLSFFSLLSGFVKTIWKQGLSCFRVVCESLLFRQECVVFDECDHSYLGNKAAFMHFFCFFTPEMSCSKIIAALLFLSTSKL